MPPGSLLFRRNNVFDIVFFVDESLQIVAVDRGAKPEENTKFIGVKLNEVLDVNALTILEQLNKSSSFRAKMIGSDDILEFTPQRFLKPCEYNKSTMYAVFMGHILTSTYTPPSTTRRRIGELSPDKHFLHDDNANNNNNNHIKRQKIHHSISCDVLPQLPGTKEEFQPLFPEFPQVSQKMFRLLQVRFSSLINSLQHAILMEDNNRRIVLANKCFCDMFSIPLEPNTLVGMDCSQSLEATKQMFLYPDELLKRVSELLLLKRQVTGEHVFLADGRVFERDYLPIFLQDTYEGHLWVYRDITTLRRASFTGAINTISKVLLSANTLSSIWTNVPKLISSHFGYSIAIVTTFNKEQDIVTPVGSCGLDNFPLLNTPIEANTSILGIAAKTSQMISSSSGASGESPSSASLMVVGVDDPLVPLRGLENYLCLPLCTSENVILGSLFLANRHDMTPRDVFDMQGIANLLADAIQREEWKHELVVARDQALDAVRLKGQFVANVSHELRTPMNVVLGMCNILLDSPLNEEQAEYVDSIRTAGTVLMQILNQILEFSKLEAGKAQLREEDVDLRTIIDSVVGMLHNVATPKNIQISSFLSPKAKSCRTDPVKLQQILLNLLGNAVKFTAEGEVTLSVTETSSDGVVSEWRFEVTDTGPGIDISEINLLFKPFVQLDGSSTRKFGGSGLGLYITRQFVDLLGGSIGVTSEKGQGSTFWFTIRTVISKSVSQSALMVEQWDTVKPSACSAALVIPTLRPFHTKCIQSLLTDCGIACTVVGSADVEHTIKSGHNQLLVTDTTLVRCLPKIAECNGNIKVIVLADKFLAIPKEPNLAFAHLPLTLRKLVDCLGSLFGNNQRTVRRNSSANSLFYSFSPCTSQPAVIKNNFAKKKVLVVEDNQLNRVLLLKLLNKEGITVTTSAENGLEALTICMKEKFDIILCDCQMPVLDGFEFAKKFRQLYGNRTPIIAVTANVMQSDIESCMAAGMDTVISKPIQVNTLRETLVKFLG
mmetsp:Transcript_2931/g.3937  ORF Transcript_2931/g.3937 Transcript_2931/m.3937 type:complete len:1002 (+) Transcript_2931:315-3320(+)